MKCEFTFKSGDNLEQIEGCGWRNAERPRDGRTNGEQTTCVADAAAKESWRVEMQCKRNIIAKLRASFRNHDVVAMVTFPKIASN